MQMSWLFFRRFLLSRRSGSVVRWVSMICISGVAVGVTALVMVISIMNGFNDAYRQRLLAVEPHLVVVAPPENVVSDLRADSHLRVSEFEVQDVLLRTVDGYFSGAVAKGISSEDLNFLLGQIAKNGIKNAARTEAADIAPGQIVMGVDLARSLGVFEGDKVTVVAPEALLLPAGEVPRFERVTVSRILSTSVAEIDGKYLFYNRDNTFANLRASASLERGIEVRLPDPYEYGPIEKKLRGLGLKVESWVERNKALFFALRMEKLVMTTLLTLSTLIASFSIVTVLVLLLTQKRKEIGLLMALGLTPLKTSRLFFGLGLMLSVTGIGIGMVVGLSICFGLQEYPLNILPSDVYYDVSIPARVEPFFIAMILLFAGIIAAVSSWLPARFHTRFTPAEGLRPARARS